MSAAEHAGEQGLSHTISHYIAGSLAAPAPQSVIEKTKLHVLDTLGAMVSGYTLRAGETAQTYAQTDNGPAQASLAVSGHRTKAEMAAFANAMAAHADETDDAHPASITHPGCAVVPAALAACEHFGGSGSDFLTAVALGYDLCARTGIALGGGRFLTEKGFDPHAFGGTIGAGAAAAALARFDMRHASWALSYAAQQTSGLGTVFRDRNHVEKAFVFAGKPARDGVVSALMVANGFTGVDDPFDGEWNFWTAFGAKGVRDLFSTLGTTFEIERTNIKRWSVGSPAQAALDSLAVLHEQDPLIADKIASIEVRLPVEGSRVVDNRSMPSVNAQHLTALMIADGGMGFISSHDEARMTDPKVLDIRKRVKLVPDEVLSRAEPSRQAIVEVTLIDGTSRRHHTTAVRGTTDNPMSWDEVVSKTTDLMTPVIGAHKTRKTIETVATLSDASSIEELAKALRRDERAG